MKKTNNTEYINLDSENKSHEESVETSIEIAKNNLVEIVEELTKIQKIYTEISEIINKIDLDKLTEEEKNEFEDLLTFLNFITSQKNYIKETKEKVENFYTSLKDFFNKKQKQDPE